MTIKLVREYGRWDSQITVQAATAGTKLLTSPRCAPPLFAQIRGIPGYFLVSKDDGSSTIYAATRPPRQVLPDQWGVRTTVYEYGGLAYAVFGDKIIFSEASDNSCRILTVPTGQVTLLVPGVPHLKYGDFDACLRVKDGHLILAVMEDHSNPLPAHVRNYIVVIHSKTGSVSTLLSKADFYSYPRWQPVKEKGALPGHMLMWREWNHPDLPFDGVTLHTGVVDYDETESVGKLKFSVYIAGADRKCVGEAAWAPDGNSIVFSIEDTPSSQEGQPVFRQLYRVLVPPNCFQRPAIPFITPILLAGLEGIEFGDATWFVGSQTFAFLTPTTLVAVGTHYSKNRLVYINVKTGAWAPLDKLDNPLVEIKLDPIAALSPTQFLVIGSSFTTPQAVYIVNISVANDGSLGSNTRIDVTADYKALFQSTDRVFPPTIFSTPELVTVSQLPQENGKEGRVYGWFWPPHNDKFVPPKGTLPPLIITPHGGPTGHSAPGLHMTAQYWASRGYAYFAINYSGSSGHGKAYRDRLWTRWGVLDTDDVAACVKHLTGNGTFGALARADARRVGIEGGSAGGYNVLQSLVHYPELFAGGVCCCGVADTEALARDTHKLESHYLDWLLWPGKGHPQVTDEEKQRIHHERSPVYHADKITAPLRLIHGDQDTVVPIAQSQSIKQQIESRGGDVDLVVLEGEGHMFVRTDSKEKYLVSEAEWWEKTLLGERHEVSTETYPVSESKWWE